VVSLAVYTCRTVSEQCNVTTADIRSSRKVNSNQRNTGFTDCQREIILAVLLSCFCPGRSMIQWPRFSENHVTAYLPSTPTPHPRPADHAMLLRHRHILLVCLSTTSSLTASLPNFPGYVGNSMVRGLALHESLYYVVSSHCRFCSVEW
jgi:hypothetical protein